MSTLAADIGGAKLSLAKPRRARSRTQYARASDAEREAA